MGYLFRFLKPSHAYYDAWVQRRRLLRQWWLALPLGMLLAGSGMALASLLFGDSPAGLIGALPGLGLIIVVQMRYYYWPCPHCGQPFLRGAFLQYDRCAHCGLEENAPCDPAEQQWEFESQVR